MNGVQQDLRYAMRMLVKNPLFSIVAILTLALGIGANAAIFSLVNTVLLRTLPVEDPARVVAVALRAKGDALAAFSYPNFVDFRDRNQALAGLLALRFVPLSLSRAGSNERVWGYEVSANYFDVLGLRPLKGRTFTPDEEREELAHPVVVVSYNCWQKRFGSDPDLVGKDVILNDHQFKVIGIAPEGFKGTEFIYTPEMWVPASMIGWVEPHGPSLKNRDAGNFFVIGRLKPGIDKSQAEASLNLLAQQLGKEYPETNEGQSIRLGAPGFILPEIRGAVVNFTWILMAAVALVLLVTCANLAGLLLARATDREREIAIRLALGANRRRLIRQLLTESILLAVVGGIAGIFLALWMINALIAFKPPIDFPLSVDVQVDWRVLIFAFAISVVTGTLFGLAPALQATRADLVPALKDAAAQRGSQRSRLRSSLVVAQIALSLVVLICAGLVVRTLRQLQTMNPGFDTHNAVMFSLDLALQGYDESRGYQFCKQLMDRVQALPGVKSAALADYVPLSLSYNSNNVFVEGLPIERGANAPSAMSASVGPRYFETMGTQLIEGREFNDQDKANVEQVAIINETFVRKLLPFAKSNSDAIGKRLSVGTPQAPLRRIVGVVKDGKYFNITEEPRSFIWRPLAQNYSSGATLIVRSSSNPESLINTIRGEIASLDPNLPLFDIKTFSEHMQLALFPAKVAAAALGVFGLIALLLATIGIYGIASHSVAQRTREIGIRMALGAQLGDVLKLILSHGVKLTVLGVLLGLVGSFLLTRLINSVLYGVSATDPLTFVLVSIALVSVALVACYLPARRATKVDPLVALKYE